MRTSVTLLRIDGNKRRKAKYRLKGGNCFTERSINSLNGPAISSRKGDAYPSINFHFLISITNSIDDPFVPFDGSGGISGIPRIRDMDRPHADRLAKHPPSIRGIPGISRILGVVRCHWSPVRQTTKTKTYRRTAEAFSASLESPGIPGIASIPQKSCHPKLEPQASNVNREALDGQPKHR